MKKNKLGEIQELVQIAIIASQWDAYGNEIQRELEGLLEDRISVGAIQTVLERMEKKVFLTPEWEEATNKSGSKRKRIYSATPYAHWVLHEMKEVRTGFWSAMPQSGTGNAL